MEAHSSGPERSRTSVGVMKEPVNTVKVAIDGIGERTNVFRQQAASHCCRSPIAFRFLS